MKINWRHPGINNYRRMNHLPMRTRKAYRAWLSILAKSIEIKEGEE